MRPTNNSTVQTRRNRTACLRQHAVMIEQMEPRILLSGAVTSFVDDFSSGSLDPAWQVVEYTGPLPRAQGQMTPANHYELSGGALKYTLDPMTYSMGFVNDYQRLSNIYYSYDPGLELQRSFDGDQWVFESKGSFDMQGSNDRGLYISVVFGNGETGETTYARFARVGEDSRYQFDLVSIEPGELAAGTYSNLLEVMDRVSTTADTRYFRLERSDGMLTVEWSTDGDAWQTIGSHDFGNQLDGLQQRVIVSGEAFFNPQGSSAAWDYVSVAPVPSSTVAVEYAICADDYAQLTIDGAVRLVIHDYGDYSRTGVLDLEPGWHDIDLIYKNRWGSNALVLCSIENETSWPVVALESLRSLDAQGNWISGLKAEYFTLEGQPITTIYGEGPIEHGAKWGDNGQLLTVYQGVFPAPWAGIFDGWSTFEERLSGQIFVPGDTPITPVIDVDAVNAVFNGQAYGGASATVSPTTDTGEVTLTYYNADDTNFENPLPDAPVNAGNYQVIGHVAAFADYTAADSAPVSFAIAKADALISVVGFSGTYNALPHGATGTATGVGGENLSAQLSLGESFTNAPGGTANWYFTGGTNYNNTTGTVDINITKASLTGIATTQDALNIAKQGAFTIDISSIIGLQNGDTVVSVFSSAVFSLTIGANTYLFAPSVSVKSQTVHVAYSLKAGTASADTLRADLLALDAADGTVSTSAAKTPYSTMWITAESLNYTFMDDFLTRLFSSK